MIGGGQETHYILVFWKIDSKYSFQKIKCYWIFLVTNVFFRNKPTENFDDDDWPVINTEILFFPCKIKKKWNQKHSGISEFRNVSLNGKNILHWRMSKDIPCVSDTLIWWWYKKNFEKQKNSFYADIDGLHILVWVTIATTTTTTTKGEMARIFWSNKRKKNLIPIKMCLT